MVDNDVKSVAASAKEAASHTGTVAGDMARDAILATGEAAANVREAAHKAASAASEFGKEAVVRGSQYGKSMIHQVEAQPLIFVVAAAAAGLIAGLIISRR